jgi:hypothetical protein
MTTPTDIERISYGGPAGALQLGAHREVIQGVGATRTLLAKESGALCLFDVAAGNIYTLPTPVEGMQFEFMSSIACTSNAHKVVTSAATVFMVGSVVSGKLAAGMDVFQADGAATVGISMAGSTTGGLIGSYFCVTAVSATKWAICGYIVGSGTLATPFI